MDKYIHIIGKRKQASVSDKGVPAEKVKRASSRLFDDRYLQTGFIWTGYVAVPLPCLCRYALCVAVNLQTRQWYRVN